MKTFTTLFLATLISCSLPCRADESQISAKRILHEIQIHGGKQALDKEYDEPNWQFIVDKIATANPEWLKVAAEFRPYSDGGSSEELDISVGLALSIDATSVLRSLTAQDDDTRIGWICGSAPIDEERSLKDTLDFYKKRKVALEAVTEVTLTAKRDVCIREILEVLKTVEERGAEY